jgi:lipopolysaccharide export system protein LptA
MACKIHADMKRLTPPSAPRLRAALLLLAASLSSPAWAEKADRNKPLAIEADAARYDDQKQSGVFTGNVVVTKGTIVMRAARMEVQQLAGGQQLGTATGAAGKLATFSQKREGLDETIEGEAERVEYDGKTEVVKLVNKAVIRRYRGKTLVDETSGATITYDSLSEVFSVQGGNVSAANPSGRVRAVLSPRAPTASSSNNDTPAPAAQPGTTPGASR